MAGGGGVLMTRCDRIWERIIEAGSWVVLPMVIVALAYVVLAEALSHRRRSL